MGMNKYKEDIIELGGNSENIMVDTQCILIKHKWKNSVRNN